MDLLEYLKVDTLDLVFRHLQHLAIHLVDDVAVIFDLRDLQLLLHLLQLIRGDLPRLPHTVRLFLS